MLEIDGEFFEDPCEMIRAVRTIAAIALLESAFVSFGIIMSQPLFPPVGEKGDIIHVK